MRSVRPLNPRHRSARASRCHGFTLTELLVVLGILGLLLAVLLPVLASARRRAGQSACLSNLRQLHAACTLYAQGDDGLLPPYPSRAQTLWDSGGQCREDEPLLLSALGPYVRSAGLWRCPGDATRPDAITFYGGCQPAMPFFNLTSYTYKGFLLSPQRLMPLPIGGRGDRLGSSGRPLLSDSASCPSDPVHAQYNHGTRWNRIYLDGHAASFGWDCTNSPYVVEVP